MQQKNGVYRFPCSIQQLLSPAVLPESAHLHRKKKSLGYLTRLCYTFSVQTGIFTGNLRIFHKAECLRINKEKGSTYESESIKNT